MSKLITRLWEQFSSNALAIHNYQLGNDFDDGTVDSAVVVCKDCYQSFNMDNDVHICTVQEIL